MLVVEKQSVSKKVSSNTPFKSFIKPKNTNIFTKKVGETLIFSLVLLNILANKDATAPSKTYH